MLETGSISRFAQVGNFSSYCRCVDSLRESNGKKKGEGNTRNGNKYLAWAFVEAANFAIRYSPQARSFYDRKKSRTNRVLATKALAHKLARATTCCVTRSPSMHICVSGNGLAKGGEPGKRTGMKPR
jgi:transposase